eukprot:augustus_masked-scaffold_9-processed-gene-6.2-mRNA-1 protein AED:1.00 eAED:1.00 QI:0/-1/0/0/-1/1/1/0/415
MQNFSTLSDSSSQSAKSDSSKDLQHQEHQQKHSVQNNPSVFDFLDVELSQFGETDTTKLPLLNTDLPAQNTIAPDLDHEYSGLKAGTISGTPRSEKSQGSEEMNQRSVLQKSVATQSEHSAAKELPDALIKYILSRCRLHESCSQEDFDSSAMEALMSIPFLQALQTVEHYAVSVSPRILKRSAYLMGILRGQEAHWENAHVANSNFNRGLDLLKLPAQLLLFIGHLSIQENVLPSDFTPDVVLFLHNMPILLAVKSIQAFNTNKRIQAGRRGGVINRPRFFLRLIQNVATQNLPVTNSPRGSFKSAYTSTTGFGSSSSVGSFGEESGNLARAQSFYEKPTGEPMGYAAVRAQSFESADVRFGKEFSRLQIIEEQMYRLSSYEADLKRELVNARKDMARLRSEYARLKSSSSFRL